MTDRPFLALLLAAVGFALLLWACPGERPEAPQSAPTTTTTTVVYGPLDAWTVETTSPPRPASPSGRAARSRRPVTRRADGGSAPLDGWSVSQASYYGPGFYGRRTACGQVYGPSVLGVAHKTLPCGTLVEFSHGGVTVVAPVNDRGPYTPGRTWDLSRELCARLAHCFTGPVRWRLV